MKRTGLIFLLSLTILTLRAQSFKGFLGGTRVIPKEQLITPYGMEVTFDKTVHIIFPAKVTYVDLGSSHIIAGKADGTENVIRIKAAVEDFPGDTNFSVICEDGSFYSFNARYASEPRMLNINMQSAALVRYPYTPVFFTELGKESPMDVHIIMRNIYKRNRKNLHHLGSKNQKTAFTVRSLYVNNGMFYFHTMLKNNSQVAFDVDYIKFKIADKQTAKRSPAQEIDLNPVRIYPETTRIKGKSKARTVYVLPKFTLVENQLLIVELTEKNGGRHHRIQIENNDLTNAKVYDKLKKLIR